MSVSMYKASIPVFQQMLGAAIGVLDKAAAYAAAKKIEPSVLINARLYPDMFGLARQIQIATDMTKGAVARLAGQEPPKYEDNEASFDELKARLKKTLDYIGEFKPTQIDGSETREIALKLGGETVNFNGENYLLHFVLPNVFFHLATAYAILRHNGVELGKRDFLQAPG